MTGKLNIVLREMRRTEVQLLGIGELRGTGKGYYRKDEYTIYFSGNDSDRDNGVAIICNKTTSASVMGYNPVSDRIITIRLQGKPINMSIIQVYAPMSVAGEENIEKYYGLLQNTVDNISKGDIMMIMGDFNAKIRKSEASRINEKHGLGERNEAGERMIKFCHKTDLRIMNTCFQQRESRLYTWT